MNFLDFLILGYVARQAWRGYRRGLVAELPGLVGVTVFFIFGWGLLKIMYHFLSEAGRLTGTSAGIVGFGGLLTASWLLVGKVKEYIGLAAARWSKENHHQIGGLIAGAGRAFLWSCVFLLVLAHGPVHFATHGFAEGSLLGSALIRYVLPVYAKTHGVI